MSATVTDQVIPDSGLAEGEVMHVFERSIILRDGRTVWLRRFTIDENDRRRWLPQGLWVAQLGERAHIYAVPAGLAGGAEWHYRDPHGWATWRDAADGARSAAGEPTIGDAL